MQIGHRVKITKIRPQDYATHNNNGKSNAASEKGFYGSFIGKVGVIYKIDHDDQFPVMIRFVGHPGDWRFRWEEIERVKGKV